ncbi:MAG: hypothetical protein ACP5MD_10010, partial [Verrucomicrobiia bacterium]
SPLEFRVYAETRRLSVRALARQGRRALPVCKGSCTVGLAVPSEPDKVPGSLVASSKNHTVVTVLLAAREADTEKLTKLAA